MYIFYLEASLNDSLILSSNYLHYGITKKPKFILDMKQTKNKKK